MIVFRYLLKEVLLSMMAVTGVVLIIIMSGRFISYLSDAAAGEITANVLFQLIGYRIPGFLELILPLGLFLGILLAYGRLYLENEMTVLNACGISPNKLQLLTFGSTLLTAVAVAIFSLWLAPWGQAQVQSILQDQESLNEFDTLAPGRFQENTSGSRVTYAKSLLEGRTRLENIFISERDSDRNNPRVSVVVAEKGRQYVDPDSGDRFLLLENGYRYEGVPGQADYRRIDFEQYGARIRESGVSKKVNKIETIPTAELLASERPDYRAALHWRLSLPVLCLVVSVLAVPLSKVNPRQGRYARLLPCILLYLSYVSILTGTRSGLEKGDFDSPGLIWLVHLVFLLIALNFHFFGPWWQRRFSQWFGWMWRLLPEKKA
ncbi:MAG: LPS export ABC transporter permease LptF [Motiliproteus sp.]|nr:LPS export ABC transporter permease LptF [Motiliproteus sp.]MCW9051914.1 LPS export ABC transporter permease LptF [Motiliproteus sp.]